jgi:hypothetical protein
MRPDDELGHVRVDVVALDSGRLGLAGGLDLFGTRPVARLRWLDVVGDENGDSVHDGIRVAVRTRQALAVARQGAVVARTGKRLLDPLLAQRVFSQTGGTPFRT